MATTGEQNDRAARRLLDLALAERSGHAPVPDLSDAIRARLEAPGSGPTPRHTGRWLTAAALLLGALATLVIAWQARGPEQDTARQDPLGPPIEYLPFDATDPQARLPEHATAVSILVTNPDQATHVSLEALQDHPNLRHARVEVLYILGPLREELTDPPTGWLAPLATCPRLETLEIRTVHPAVQELGAFADHPQLRAVGLHHPEAWTGKETAILAGIPQLERLSLTDLRCGPDDPGGLTTLGRLAGLTELELSRVQGFDGPQQLALAAAFPRWPRLAALQIDTPPGAPAPGSDSGTQELGRGFLEQLGQLDRLERLALTGSLTAPIEALKLLPRRLRRLVLRGASAARFLQLPPLFWTGLHSLERLDGLVLLPSAAGGSARFDRQIAEALEGHPLRHLHLPIPRGPELVDMLRSQEGLRSLTLTDFGHTAPTGLDLSWLADISDLEQLRLQASEPLLESCLEQLTKSASPWPGSLRQLILTTSDEALLARWRAAVAGCEVRSGAFLLDR